MQASPVEELKPVAAELAVPAESHERPGSSKPLLNDPTPKEDSMYEAFFSAVGAKPNMSYEGLLKLLPTVKANPNGLANPAPTASMVVQQLLTPLPDIHPMRKEWMDAAGELDDDVPLEEGEWLDVSALAKEPEVLDEEGIPVVSAISRSSSGCILDAPGAVQVDNFTEEPDSAEAAAATAAYMPSSGQDRQARSRTAPQPPPPAPPQQQQLLPATLLSQTSGSVLAAAAAARASAAPSAAGPVTNSATSSSNGGPPGPVRTLEDELRAMGRGRPRARAPSSGAAPSAAPAAPAATAASPPRPGPAPADSDSDEEGAVVIEEVHPGSAANGGPAEQPWLDAPVAMGNGNGNGNGHHTSASGDGVAEEQDGADGGGGGEQGEGLVATLPGEALVSDSGADTRLMAVNTRDMLQRMGLGDEDKGSGDDSDDVDLALDLTRPAGGSAQGSTGAAAAPVPEGIPDLSVVGQADAASTSGAGVAAAAGGGSDDGEADVTYVEGFRLDPDFDYDNVKLTPRGFPYNLRAPKPFPFGGKQ